MNRLKKLPQKDQHPFFNNIVKENIINLGKFSQKTTLYTGFYENYNVCCYEDIIRKSLFSYSILYIISLCHKLIKEESLLKIYHNMYWVEPFALQYGKLRVNDSEFIPYYFELSNLFLWGNKCAEVKKIDIFENILNKLIRSDLGEN